MPLLQGDVHGCTYETLERCWTRTCWWTYRHKAQCSLLTLQGDMHGCPYKTLDKDSLRAALQRLRVDPATVEETVTKAKVRAEQHGRCVGLWPDSS